MAKSMTHMKITNHEDGSVEYGLYPCIDFVYNDGGRSKYFDGKKVGDCVTRAVAIASGRDYKEVYDFLAEGNAKQRVTKTTKRSKKAMRKARK